LANLAKVLKVLKVLKGLKSLNFWDFGESRFFTFMFAGDGPHPKPLKKHSPQRHPEGTRPCAQGEGEPFSDGAAGIRLTRVE
jgi:hypothetical protein